MSREDQVARAVAYVLAHTEQPPEGPVAADLRYSNMLTNQPTLPSTLGLTQQLTSIISTGWASQWYGVP
ncbi:hypothetical protein [Streptomyces sp. G-G2]|uniref:hypothetical protein n=1 Tax=Streptomyces sp. G-G2 TaxID=3046201 RepID=UPI0024BA68EC|nr:hypothetical protein [Streptomyces sp. G-G2]MDJ0385868.1 hypothetical protein [Streptomyces sp. G-G2]